VLVGQDNFLGELWRWMENGRPISVRVLTGRAGSGKTRLALELCEQASERGWRAGFVTANEVDRFRDKQDSSAWGWNAPTLIVIDYVASRAEQVNAWLAELSNNEALLDEQAGSKRPLRLLLVERQADPTSGWWLTTFGRGGEDARAIQALLDPAVPVSVPQLLAAADRRAVIAGILERVGSKERFPTEGEDRDFDRRLSELSWGGEPLMLMMAGMAAARSGFTKALSLSRTDLAFGVADDELARIERIAKSRGIAPDFLRHMSAYVTLCQGLDRDAAIDAIKEEKAALDRAGAGDPPVILDTLQQALPTSGDRLDAILPDVIGEAVALRALGSLGEAGSSAAVLRAMARVRQPVLTSVIRTAQDYAGEGHSQPLAWLDGITRSGQANVGSLVEIAEALPPSTLVLRERAAAITESIVGLLRQSLVADGSEEAVTAKSNLARWLNHLANRLSALGLREEALVAAREAADLFRELVAARLDAFHPHLASSLNNLANTLGELGRWEEALVETQKAVDIQRELAAARPDPFRAGLANSLSNLAIRLSALGRREEALAAAQEATDLYRQLTATQPDTFRPNLAGSLDNLAMRLSALGRRKEALSAAQEAADIRRELAARRPDAFRPDLAGSLTNLAVSFGKFGWREEALSAAQEAADLYRELAAARPGAFRPDLASSLSNLANFLGELGRLEDALAAAEEAADLFRELAATRPDAFRADLAMSLTNLTKTLGELERLEKALAAAQEAVDLYRELAAARPDAFRPDLAMSLNNLANTLSELGRLEKALAAAQEATDIRRELAATRPDAFQGDLAMSLNNLANGLSALERREEALVAAQEAADIRRELAAAAPDAFRADLAWSVTVLANCLSALGRQEEALEYTHEAVAMLLPAFQALPQAYARHMSFAARTYVELCEATGRIENLDFITAVMPLLVESQE
jgi:tetratricopeptide (TPR) repeat protein